MLEIQDYVSKQLNTLYKKGLVVFKHLIADYVVISSEGWTDSVGGRTITIASKVC